MYSQSLTWTSECCRVPTARDSANVMLRYSVKLGTPSDGQTETPGIEIGAALNVTSGGNNFNDFPDNQLTKCRVFIG